MKSKSKVIAIGLLSLMVLSSIASAIAYPSPFIEDGEADVAVIYGSRAQSSDWLAISDLLMSLQAAFSAQNGQSGGNTSITGGDFVRLDRPSNRLNLGDKITDTVITSIGASDMPNILTDGTYYDNDNGAFGYTQKIDFAPLTLQHFRDSDYSNTPAIGFVLPSGTKVLTYTLDFTKNPSFTDEKFSNTEISLFGNEYFVLDADESNKELTLLEAAETLFLEEGEEQNQTIRNKAYKIFVSFIGEEEVKLVINDEITRSLSEGETYRLKDGAYVGVKDILYNGNGVVPSRVEFSIGSGRIELADGQNVRLNEETITGLTSHLTVSSGTLDKISIEWSTDEEEFITFDKELEMPVLNAVKLSMAGMQFPNEETVAVESDGSSSIKLRAPIKSGTAEFNILFSDSSGAFQGIGKDEESRLAIANGNTLTFDESRDDWFIISWSTSTNAESYLLSARTSEEAGSQRVTIRDRIANVDLCSSIREGETCAVGNVVLTVQDIDRTGSNRLSTFRLSEGGSFNTLYTVEGLKIDLPTEAEGSSVSISFTEEDKEGRIGAGKSFSLVMAKNSDNRLHVSSVVGADERRVGESDRYQYYVVSDLATKIIHDRTSTQNKATVTYHGDEVFADVFLTALEAEVNPSTDNPSQELGSSVIMSDQEIDSAENKNWIAVGGSCVNDVAADLVGGVYCGVRWEEETGVEAGSFLIQTFERENGKLVTLVAGYDSTDTITGVKALKNPSNNIEIAAGRKYIGTSSSSVELVEA